MTINISCFLKQVLKWCLWIAREMTNLTSCLSKPLNILHMLFIESSCHQNLFGMNKFQIDWLDLVLIVSRVKTEQIRCFLHSMHVWIQSMNSWSVYFLQLTHFSVNCWTKPLPAAIRSMTNWLLKKWLSSVITWPCKKITALIKIVMLLHTHHFNGKNVINFSN